MEIEIRACPYCPGTVSLEASGYALAEGTAYGQCDSCNQQFETNLIIEAEEELIPVESR